MNLIVAAVIGGLIQAAGSLVGRVLLALGIGVVTYTGVDASITFARDRVVASLQGLPADALGILSACGAGQAVSMIASAYVARLTIAGLTSGTLTKWVKK